MNEGTIQNRGQKDRNRNRRSKRKNYITNKMHFTTEPK